MRSKRKGYDVHDVRDRFVLFLKRHHLVIPFIVNHSIRNRYLSGLISNVKIETFSEYMDRVPPSKYMDGGFVKKDTTEGEAFWSWYSQKWKAVHEYSGMYWKMVRYFVELEEEKAEKDRS